MEGSLLVVGQEIQEEGRLAYPGSQVVGSQEEDRLAFREAAQAYLACQEEGVSRTAWVAPSLEVQRRP